MKKLILILIISTTFFQCTTDDQADDEMVTNNNNNTTTSLFTISTSNDYYSENELNTGNPKIFLTDENGEIITEDNLDNGSTVELTAEYDINNNNYDVTLLKKELSSFSQITNYHLETYIDIYPHHYEIQNIEDLNPNNEEVMISIINSNGILDDFFGFAPGSVSENNGTYTCNSTLNEIPDNYFLSFKKSTEDFKRYIWLEDVTGETNDTFEFNQTEIIQNPTSITYPNNESVSSVIEGINSNNPNKMYELSYQWSNDGSTELDHFIPNGLFDQYWISNSIKTGSENYTTFEKSNIINSNYAIPNLSLEVVNNSYNLFQINSSSDFDFYSASFSYVSPDEDFAVY